MGTDFRRCGEIDEEMKQKLNEMHVGRLIHILSHTMKRHNPAEVMENDDLTTMQKHVLKFILLETMHRDLYQKDIEEEFQIRKPTVTGILKPVSYTHLGQGGELIWQMKKRNLSR